MSFRSNPAPGAVGLTPAFECRRREPSLPAWLSAAGLRPHVLAYFGGEVLVAGQQLRARHRGDDAREIGWERIAAPVLGDRPRFWHDGRRGLFRSPARRCTRLVIRDGALAAICRAAAEGPRPDSVYVGLPGALTDAAGFALIDLLHRGRLTEAVVAVGEHDQGRRTRHLLDGLIPYSPGIALTHEPGLHWRLELARAAEGGS